MPNADLESPAVSSTTVTSITSTANAALPLNLEGTPADDSLSGGLLNDTLSGGEGNDTLIGAAGDDLLDGGVGDDVLRGDQGENTVHGGDGNDFVTSEHGSGHLTGGNGNDNVWAIGVMAGTNPTMLDGGTGNDHLFVSLDSPNAGSVRLRGGSGSDAFTLTGQAQTFDVTIEDFSAADGDLINVLGLLGSGAVNERAVLEHFRVEQVGSDAVIWYDRDGMSSNEHDWQRLLTMKDVQLASLTAENFSSMLVPNQQVIALQLVGTPDDDNLAGGQFDDVLSGAAGNDTLHGGSGQDLLIGGDGADSLAGGRGNDTFWGGEGADHLLDESGNGQLFGDGGDDYLQTTSNGVSFLDGGDGNDTLSGGSGTATLQGGAGDDTIRVKRADSGSIVSMLLYGDDGADTFDVTDTGSSAYLTAAGGGGRDTYRFSGALPGGLWIFDFAAGEGGDMFDVSGLLPSEALGSDPFAAGYLRVLQNGEVTQLQVDRDAGGTAHEWDTIALLGDVYAYQLTSANFIGVLAPDRLPLHFTDFDDVVRGSVLPDTLNGLDGTDHLFGMDGDDILIGGDGHDVLYGGAGNDKLYGGTGADRIHSSEGYDIIDGGAGLDDLAVIHTSGDIRGGDGNDKITVNGTGSSAQPVLIDGGSGKDLIQLNLDEASAADIHAAGGSGKDTYRLSGWSLAADLTIRDFSTAEGDILDLFDLLPTGESNPFGSPAYLRAEQNGGDTIIWYDRDGAAGEAFTWQRLITLTGVDLSSLGLTSFTGGLSVTSESNPLYKNGGDGNDSFTGGAHADTLIGGAGNDTLRGGAGDDSIMGGGGRDVLQAHTGDDTLDGGDGLDTVVFDGSISDYGWTQQGGVITTHSPNGWHGSDTLRNVERFVFDEATIAMDVGADGTAGQVYRLYQAAFGRQPDGDGLVWWVKAADGGMSLNQIATHFMQSAEFTSLYGPSSNTSAFVRALYVNALHRAPDDAGVAYWTEALDKGYASANEVLTFFSESPENQESVASVIGSFILMGPWN